jgi:hypothetical protein
MDWGWINMIAPSKVVLEKFKILVVKMAQNALTIEFEVAIYELLCDIDTIIQLTCVMPMLGNFASLSKYAQN